MTARDDIIKAALVYLDAPFVTNGRGKYGIDCIGLPICVARDLRVHGWQDIWDDPDLMRYPGIRAKGVMRAKFRELCEKNILRKVEKQNIRPGDLALRLGGFMTDHEHHVSIIAPGNMHIEAINKPEPPRWRRGRVVHCTITPQVARSIICGFQFREVD